MRKSDGKKKKIDQKKASKTTPKKVRRSPMKVIRRIIKKIRRVGKKLPVRRRVARQAVADKNIDQASLLKFSVTHEQKKTYVHFQPDRRLPDFYSENKLVLLVRDPWWLYSYWEVTPQREMEIASQIAGSGLYREKTILRVYDVTGTTIDTPNSCFDIEIYHLNSNWYIDVGAPDREWVAEIGIKASGGRFFALVRSNAVKTPPFGISDVLDEEWMMPDEMYYKLLGVVGGSDVSGDSLSIRRLLERYVRVSVSSEGSPKLSKKT